MLSTNSELILIVDDTPINLNPISDILIDQGFEVAIATSGEGMFKQLQWHLPDLILLDVKMPVMDGFEVCQRLKTMERVKDIPVIFMTGLSDNDNKSKGFELGAVDYITKPFQETEVLARIKNHLQLRRLTKNLEEQVSHRTMELELANQQLAQKQIELERANHELETLNTSLEQQVQEQTQQLRQNERQLRLFVEHTPVGVAMFDRHMNYLVASQRWINDYQLEPPIIGKCHYDVFPNGHDYWREVHQRCLQGNVERNEKDLYISANGSQEWVRWEVRPWYEDADIIGGIIIFGEIISDRIRTEIALQESEERYRLLSEVSPVGIFFSDTRGNCTYSNEKTQQIAGINLGEDLRNNWVKNIHPEDRAHVNKAWNNFVELSNLGCDTEYEVEHRYLYPDGSIKWTIGQAVPERNSNGELVGFIGSVVDITNLKQIEDTLRQVEAKQRALINALPDLIMRVNREGIYLDFIPTNTFQILANDQGLIGFPITEKFPADLAAKRMEAIHEVLRTREMLIYEQELYFDGKAQTEECRVVACGEDDVLIVVRDISDRKQSEAALKTSQKITETRSQQVYSLLNNIPHIAWLKDLDGHFLAVNEPFANSCGYEATQLVGLTDLDIWPQELAELYRSDDLDVMQSRKRKQFEEKLVASDGRTKWIETFKAPVISEANESIGTAGIAIDITERKQGDLALQSLMQGTASVTGKEFFPELVKQIAIALDVSHVFIAQKVGEELETLAWYATDQIQPNLIYQISHTPCELALNGDVYYCNDIKQAFPDNDKWNSMNVNSYMGVALYNTIGEAIGVLFTLNSQQLADPQRAEMLLRIFGARAIAELERMQALENLQTMNEELERRVQERTKELSQTRNFLEAIIENLPVALFVKSGKEERFGEFLLWNRTSEIMFGCTKEQAIGKSVYDFFPKEQSDFFNAKDRNSFLLGQTEDIPEEPIDSLTLGRRILHTIKVPIFDEQGEPDYLICISEDITDRKLAEQNLKAERLRLQIALEVTEMGTWEANMDTGYWSPRTEAIFGYAPTTFPGDRESFLKLVYAEDQERVFNALTHSFATQEPYNVEYRINHVSGEIRWVAVNGKVVQSEDGNGLRIIGVALDITDRKQAEYDRQQVDLALRESQNFLQTVIDTFPLIVFWKDRQSVYLGCNQKSAIACGLNSPSEIIGKTDYDMPWAKTEAANYRADDLQVMESGQAKLGIIETQLRADGSMSWIETNKLPLYNLNGEIIGLLGTYQDISDRKQTEIVLRQYERMVEISPDGMALINQDYTYLLVNQTYLRQNEREWDNTVGHSMQEVMGEYTFQTIVKPKIDRCLAGETIDYGDWFYFKKAGNRFVSVTYYPYFEVDGTITGVVISNRDVTERREAEVSLRDSEERLRLALTAANQGLYDLNPQTGVAIVSSEYATMLGYNPNDFQETHEKWLERIHPDDLERVVETHRSYINGEIPNYKVEFRQRTKTGDWKWILSLGKVVEWDQDQKPLRMLGTNTDISDRKLAEKSLQEERLRLQLALDAARMGSWGCNIQTEEIFWSDRAQEIFGFVPGTFPGDRATFLSMVHPDDHDRLIQTINRTFETGDSYQIEYRIRRLDGEICWIAVWGIIHQNTTLGDRQLIGVVEDISNRKRAELERDQLLQNMSQLNSELEQANQQLEEYSQTLEQRVEERTNELQAAQERIIAQEKLASLGTLTAGIAHELRNPLNFVKNYAEGSIELTQDLLDILQPIIQSQTSDNSELIETLITDLQENATTIRLHSQRADKIITSMMQHARTDNNQANIQSTSLHDLLNEAVKLACHSKWLQDSTFKVTINTNYAADVGMIEAIPNHLIRAFINLVDNACDAMRSKKRDLSSNPNPSDTVYIPTLTVTTQLIGETVEIRMRDNGCGIAPHIQTRILDPFFTTKPPGAGTGLGLSLTHDIIVKQHKGTMMINSNIGEFTEIVVTIPIAMLTK